MPEFSDHSLLEVHMPIRKPASVPDTLMERSWSKFDKAAFHEALQISVLCDPDYITSAQPLETMFETYDCVVCTVWFAW